MEFLKAFDLTHSARAAGALASVDAKTVARHVAIRDAGAIPFELALRPKIIDASLEKIEELVERSNGKVRADVVDDRHLAPMDFAGDERTTRRAVALAKAAYDPGHRRTYRPWIPEPGMWAQYDWAKGPTIGERTTNLVLRLARLVALPVRDGEALYKVIDAAYERRSVAVSSNIDPAGRVSARSSVVRTR